MNRSPSRTVSRQLRPSGFHLMAFDLRLMMAQIQRHGMHGRAGAVQVLEGLLGRPLRTYQHFVKELAGA